MEAVAVAVAAAVADAALAGVARVALGYTLAAFFVTALLAVAAADRLTGAKGGENGIDTLSRPSTLRVESIVWIKMAPRRRHLYIMRVLHCSYLCS